MYGKLDKLRALIQPTTQADIDAYFARQARDEREAAQQAQLQRQAAIAKANPEPTLEELALPPVPVYLLFRNEQDVEWALRRTALEMALIVARTKGSAYALDHIVQVQVPGWVARRLGRLPCMTVGVPKHAGRDRLPAAVEGFVREARLRSINPPAWQQAEGNRVFIVFTADGYCGWSASGNNLASIVARAEPRSYIGEPMRVELSAEQEAQLCGYAEWALD